MRQQTGVIGRRLAVLGSVVALTVAGSTGAEATVAGATGAGAGRVVAAPLEWTETPVRRAPAFLNDLATHPAATWAVGGDLVDDELQEQRPFALQWKAGRWVATPQPMRTDSTLESVAIAGPADVWAVGEDRADPA